MQSLKAWRDILRPRTLLPAAALVAAAAVVLVFAPEVKSLVRDAGAPYERAAAGAASAFDSAGKSPSALRAENAELRRRVAELEQRVAVLQAADMEHAKLRRQAGFAIDHRSLVPAEVLSVGGTDGWTQRLRIGKGRRHGVLRNAAVVSRHGLVGRVISVSETTSEVLLVSDPNSRVACALDPPVPGGVGIVSGRGGAAVGEGAGLTLLQTPAPLRLDYLRKDAQIPGGACVVTSGQGGLFPPGLLVGRVREVRLDPTGLYLQAEVVPDVDIPSLRYVAVLKTARETPEAPDA